MKTIKAMKWHLCVGRHHLWPDSFKQVASRCCVNQVRAADTHVPDYVCASGKHLWRQSEEAQRCCNGYVPVWRTMGQEPTKENPFVLRQRVLVPAETVTDMDALASAPEETQHLYLPM